MSRRPAVELTRRDALWALTLVGGGSGAITARWAETRREATRGDPGSTNARRVHTDSEVFTDHQTEALVALARVLYPSSAAGVDEFVRTYLHARSTDRPDHGRQMARETSGLDALARDWHGKSITALDRRGRDQLLREVGADTADPDPTGTTAERVRYYLVNELLFAFYASPTGGRLVGIENPQGYPGGIDSYRREAPE